MREGGYVTKDSGKDAVYPTGAQRDNSEGKGRFDLVPYTLILRLAQLLERAAPRRGDHNWRKGLPTGGAYESMMRHAAQANEVYTCQQLGKVSPLANEDHLAAMVFNAAVIMQNEADEHKDATE